MDSKTQQNTPEFREATREAGRAATRAESRKDTLQLLRKTKVGGGSASKFLSSLRVQCRVEDATKALRYNRKR